MKLKEFKKLHAQVKPSSAIVSRWQSRVVVKRLDVIKAAGARRYIAQYGRSIGAEKAVMFARQAEINGCKEMAEVFWGEALRLANSKVAPRAKAKPSIKLDPRLRKEALAYLVAETTYCLSDCCDSMHEMEALDQRFLALTNDKGNIVTFIEKNLLQEYADAMIDAAEQCNSKVSDLENPGVCNFIIPFAKVKHLIDSARLLALEPAPEPAKPEPEAFAAKKPEARYFLGYDSKDRAWLVPVGIKREWHLFVDYAHNNRDDGEAADAAPEGAQRIVSSLHGLTFANPSGVDVIG